MNNIAQVLPTDGYIAPIGPYEVYNPTPIIIVSIIIMFIVILFIFKRIKK